MKHALRKGEVHNSKKCYILIPAIVVFVKFRPKDKIWGRFNYNGMTLILMLSIWQDLLQSEADLAKCFGRIKFLVLDEADRLLEPSFETELVVIAKALPSKRQTLLFSATMTKSLVTMQEAALQDAYSFQA